MSLGNKRTPATIFAAFGSKGQTAVTTRGTAALPALQMEQSVSLQGASLDDLSKAFANFQRQVMQAVRDIIEGTIAARACPIVDGNLFRGLTIGAGATIIVPHGLDRAFVGWFVTRLSGVARSSITEGTAPAGVTDSTGVAIQNTGGASAVVDAYIF